MIAAQPSRTALRVALRRAAHQVRDAPPLVFDDPLALQILPAEVRGEVARTPDSRRRPHSAALRAFMVARARVAEDSLRDAVGQGRAEQYVVLGAGLDTFAYRNPFTGVRVFEVDHPATQAWKLECLAAAGIEVPAKASHVPVDFEQESLGGQLAAAGFRWDAPTVVAWLGVVPYLTETAFRSTLGTLAALPERSQIVFDYAYPRELLPPVEQLMLDSMSARVAQAGEPFRLFFSEAGLRAELGRAGLAMARNLGTEELNQLYFAGRSDGLRLRGSAGHICIAERQ